MELRHLRCFIAVAEELHFARAAERLHMEQSALSRAIKELEYQLGVQLFERTTCRTRLTWAGKVMLDEAHRIFAAIEQAKASVKDVATGYPLCWVAERGYPRPAPEEPNVRVPPHKAQASTKASFDTRLHNFILRRIADSYGSRDGASAGYLLRPSHHHSVSQCGGMPTVYLL